MATIRHSIYKAKGYSGKMAGRSYIARIDGLSSEFGLSRKFLEPNEIDWGDSEMYRKSKGRWTEKYDLSPGVYEVVEFGERDYRVIFMKDGKAAWGRVPQERATAIAKLMSEGAEFETARLATRPVGV